MLIATHNVNGVRAADRRGLRDWLAADWDAVAFQEVRCDAPSLPDGVFGGFHVALDPGRLAGRNGVALATRTPPTRIATLSGKAVIVPPGGEPVELECETIANRDLRAFAHEGRLIEADIEGLRLSSVYVPKGGVPTHHARRAEEADQARFERKFVFLAGLARHITASRREAAASMRKYLLMGDVNIAHTRQDLRNWRSNQRSEGFLPEERAWLGSILRPRSLVDVVRLLRPGEDGPYSWWSWRGQAFANDVGWRIDYHLASPSLAGLARRGFVDKAASYESRISDHAPVVVEYGL